MNDDIIIGAGTEGNSFVILFDYIGILISENNETYRITDKNLDIRLTIFKYTDEGLELNQLLEPEHSVYVVRDFIISIILKNISIEKFNSIISSIKEYSFNAGRKHMAEHMTEQFRKLLDLN